MKLSRTDDGSHPTFILESDDKTRKGVKYLGKWTLHECRDEVWDDNPLALTDRQLKFYRADTNDVMRFIQEIEGFGSIEYGEGIAEEIAKLHWDFWRVEKPKRIVEEEHKTGNFTI